MSDARYAVGIDLGTTHSVISYADLQDEQTEHRILPIPQLTQPGSVEERPQLPSFLYQPHASELNPDDLKLPWAPSGQTIAGTLARNLGTKTPLRLVASAKSWLCHSGIDRHAAMLPLNSPEDVEKISPVEATYQYLRHLQQAWDHQLSDHPLIHQDVTITVPASFDPAARDLTAEAAQRIGFQQLTLLEEPQAAVYSWLQHHHSNWRDQLTVGDVILVVDIGGGTTDFSLVAVSEEQGNLNLTRVAVGDHILLGGDNMDLALAYRIKSKLAQQGKNLQTWQIQAITQACRDAKETLLTDNETQSVPIVVPSRGSSLLGGTLRTELTREEVRDTLVEGFFPISPIDQHPQQQQTRGALQQQGLPYAQDPAITRHLAAFLCRQQHAADQLLGEAHQHFIKPSAVLFNGGVLKSPELAQRIMQNLNQWLQQADVQTAKQLPGSDLDLAVARGAAYYGQVRQGQGIRIRGGTASAYYVGIESSMPAIPGMEPPMQALCVAPFGMEEGTATDPTEQQFGLVVGEPVQFRFYGSTVRRNDNHGTLLEDWPEEELETLPDIQAELPVEGRQRGEVVAVKLIARITELGTLRLEAQSLDRQHTWQVEFDVRTQ